ELSALQSAGSIPAIVSRETVQLSRIAELYDPDGSGTADARRAIVSESDAAARLTWALTEAARAGASDLKIYERDTETNIRVKVAGREYDLGSPWTPKEGWVAMNFLFNQRDDGGQHVSMAAGKFQSFSVSAGGSYPLPRSVIKLRGQKGFHETDHGLGTHMVLRLFYNDQAAATGSLADLGFDDEVYEALQHARDRLAGCVIIGGATGDGKSTTLIRTMDKLYEETKGAISIVTNEDPVEYRARGAGIIQIPVGSSGDAETRKANYRQALMHFVRINPDVGVISEIRDADGAKEILQFVASGHASYTTIHTESASEILFRLIDMGVAPEELAKPGGIRLLMKQTLVPLLCPHCSKPARADDLPRQAKHLAFHPIRMRNTEGCEHCTSDRGSLGTTAWAGYQRLIAVGEVIEPTEEWFRYVIARDAFGARNHWLRPKSEGGLGGTSLGLKVARHVVAGRLDAFDAITKGADFHHPSLISVRVVGAAK
ncbi:MAG: Flp pilus assembly complex ATPase component TadA, partial [Paracoccaceae bacterium]|nr:Flp pilus assembly complex ATPase component TadA [Paracoccaceae bacterium]